MEYIKLEQICLRVSPERVLNKDIVNSIKEKGFLAAHPILLIGKRVCDGNQRVLALRSLSSDELEQALLPFNGLVPCRHR